MLKHQRFPALRVRDFRLFWFGQVISLSGTWMHSIAQSWLVYSISRSPLDLGIIASLSTLPILLFTLFGGMAADRYSKRKILLMTQVLSIPPAVILGILTQMEIVRVWHIGVTAFFMGTVNAFDIPARQSFFAEIVGREEITSAVALNSVAFNGARITGPMVAGFIITMSGIPMCFFLNALSFVPAFCILLKIREKVRGISSRDGMLEDMRKGLVFLRTEKPVLCLMLWISLFSLFGIPYVTMLPVISSEILGSGVKGFSFLIASSGLGSLIAAGLIAYRGETGHRDIIIPFSGIVFSAGIFFLVVSEHLNLSLAINFAAGWGLVTFLANSNSYIQHLVPDALRGKIMSVYALVFLGLAPAGNSVIGLLADFAGTVTAVKTFAVVCIAGSLAFTFYFRKYYRNIGAYL